MCHGCFKHVPRRYIEVLMRLTTGTADREFAINMNQVVNIMVTLQRCPKCVLGVLNTWEKKQKTKKGEVPWAWENLATNALTVKDLGILANQCLGVRLV